MSISQPRPENPCKKFIDFKGDTGQFFYYDKEKEVKVEIPLPIYFIVLDELSTITGFNKKHDSGIYSNEVHSTLSELLRVKTFKGGEEIIGLYADIKDNIIALGGKYTKSVYAMLINSDKSTEFVNFKFHGASFSGWLEKKVNTDKSIVGIVGNTEAVNGAIKYKVPIFKNFAMTPQLKEDAILMDTALQAYLEIYKENAPQKSEANPLTAPVKPEPSTRTETAAEINQGLKSEMPPTPDEFSQMPAEFDDVNTPDNLDDLPF